MTPDEIRAIRGALSRPAFARLLGVTALTVFRWELPEGSKESRRPRARMIEQLRRLAADGLTGASPSPVNAGALEHVDEDDEDDASEPAVPAPPAGRETATNDEREVAAVLPALERLHYEGWPAAEEELLRLLASGTLATEASRTFAMLGLAHAELLRLNVRGALTATLPILSLAERDDLPGFLRARAHLMGALLFSAIDARTFDGGRANAHAAHAEALLPEDAFDLRILVAWARIAASRFLGRAVLARTYDAYRPLLHRAASPLARLAVHEIQARVARGRGDDEAATRHGEAALELAGRLGLEAMALSMLADRAWRQLRAAVGPDAVLEVTQRVRDRTRAAQLPPGEANVRALGAESEALCRLGRYREAAEVLAEGMQVGSRIGAPRYALAVPAVHCLEYLERGDELVRMAEAFESDASTTHGNADIHAALLRAVAANLAGDEERAIEHADRVCGAPEMTPGIDYVAYDAWFELLIATMVLGDSDATHRNLARFEAFLTERPSVWHTGILRRVQGFAHLLDGRVAEARQKLESTITTFVLTGDIAQVAFANLALAVTARAAGAPDAGRREEAALAKLREMNVAPRRNLLEALKRGAQSTTWTEQTRMERMVIAIERLALPGLSAEQARSELSSVLAALLPGRDVELDTSESAHDTFLVTDNAGTCTRVAVVGALDPEERASLHVLSVATSARSNATPRDTISEGPLDDQLPDFIAVSAATRRLKREIAQLSRSSATILISGESGSGKEIVARAVHDLSARAAKPYVAFNCASVPRELFDGQLFGFRKGAFTGASADNAGVIRAADGGTLFLDEIGELPMETQPKLLRFLENGEVFPLGEQRPRRVDVRVLAATHRDLERLVREGHFREDLYYRLNVIPLHVPPLRERREDILAIARMFVARLAPRGEERPDLASDAVRALEAYTWPGNVRELRNVIERAMAYAPIPRVLGADHLRLGGAR